MANWDSIDGVREPSSQSSPEELRAARALALRNAIEDIRALRRESLPEFLAILERRNIQHFVHFTRLENLEGILRSGLIPPAMLERQALATPFVRTDNGRWDGVPEASCLSVTRPNHLMFQSRHGDGKSWVVLGFSAAKVLELPSIFIETNAATGGRKYRHTASLQYMRNKATAMAFEEMFPNDEWLKRLKIEPNQTSDPQAEVLVLDTISPDMLTFVAPYRASGQALEPLFSLCPSHVEWLIEPSERRTVLASGRVDDSFWKSIKYGR